jgi:hypothetical protein
METRSSAISSNGGKEWDVDQIDGNSDTIQDGRSKAFCQTNNNGRGAIGASNDTKGFNGHIPTKLLPRNGGDPL